MLLKRGHKVILLTTCERGYLHEYAGRLGAIAESANSEMFGKLKFYRRNYTKLAHDLKQYKIDIVIAHQQVPALVAGICRKFKKFRLIYIRHNTDESYKTHPRKSKWLNKLANAVTPVKVAPSEVVRRFWIENEKVSENQIFRINYGYNFEQYEKPDFAEATKIRNRYKTKFLILSIARLVQAKRHKDMAVSLSLNFGLVPKYGAEGAARANIITYSVMAITCFLFVRKFFILKYE